MQIAFLYCVLYALQFSGQSGVQCYTLILLFYNSVMYDLVAWWLGGVTVGSWTLDQNGRGFNSLPGCCQVTTLGKLFTPMCLCYQAV